MGLGHSRCKNCLLPKKRELRDFVEQEAWSQTVIGYQRMYYVSRAAFQQKGLIVERVGSYKLMQNTKIQNLEERTMI
jgi:hypothetical protein